MKKVLLTVAIAAVFAFSMIACNNNKPAEETADTTAATEQVCEHQCEHECAHNCQDSACAATNCENCTKKGTDECCKVKAGEKEACNHECTGNHECCKHECEHKCEKANK